MTRNSLRRLAAPAVLIGLILAMGVSLRSATAQPVNPEKPFILPFQDPPGPNTWLFGQAYGNTVGAYRQRHTTYRLGQGIHFGVDLSAPCGTPIVALADGVVFAVDYMNFGAAPHNLTIDHPTLGYATFYGHLRERPDLQPGQRVKQGQVVAFSGDPAETCYGRPHLHLETRDLQHGLKGNPIDLMQADWDNLALVGQFDHAFERDLNAPRKWQCLDDQPEAHIGGQLLNNFAHPWPPDVALLPQGQPALVPDKQLLAAPLASDQPRLRRLTSDGCCTQPYWSPDSKQVLFVDRPDLSAPTGIWGVDVAQAAPAPRLLTETLGVYTPDMAFRIDLVEDTTTIERVADGARWTVPAGGRSVSISPVRTRIAWQVADEQAPSENRTSQIWTARLDGSEARKVVSLPRGRFAGWISDDVLLVSGRDSLTAREQVLYRLPLADGRPTELVRSERLRGELLSPDGSWAAYLITFDPDPAKNGLWLVSTDGAQRRRLEPDLFGAYQWRDARRLLVIPLKPKADAQELWEVNADTGETRRLTDPKVTPLKIANADAAVSPDGRYLAFVASQDHNVWLLTLP